MEMLLDDLEAAVRGESEEYEIKVPISNLVRKREYPSERLPFLRKGFN